MDNNEEKAKLTVRNLIIAASDKNNKNHELAIQYLQLLQLAAKKGDLKALKLMDYIQKEAKNMTQSAKLGNKLNYIKLLKGECPKGLKLVYFKKGGQICKACESIEEGGTVNKKLNPVLKFKKDRKQLKLDPKTTKHLPNGKYPNNWTIDDKIIWERNFGDMDEGAGVVENKGIGKNACGSKLRKRK